VSLFIRAALRGLFLILFLFLFYVQFLQAGDLEDEENYGQDDGKVY